MRHTVRFVPIANMADGSTSGLHIHELDGPLGDGPTLGICGVLHGNEPTGAQIILDFARAVSDRPFRGRLRLLPVANPHAFAANERFTPIDWVNLNRVFPGRMEGTYSDQLATVISRELLDTVDALVDLHSGTDRPTVDYSYLLNDEGLSRSTMAKILYRAGAGKGTTYSGTSATRLEASGTPVVVVELGGGIIDQEPYVRRGVEALFNVMRYLDMMDGAVEEREDQIVINSIELVRPTQGGFLEVEAPPLGARIEGGDVLGRIVSPYTFEELEVIENPVEDGIMILSHLTRNLVQPGDYAFMVGNLEGHTK